MFRVMSVFFGEKNMTTTREIGTTLLTSLTGSSFDIGNMSKIMAEANVAGPRAILERNQERTNVELDALKFLKGNLTAFKTHLTDLTSPALFSNKTATSSAESVVSVVASSHSAVANYQVESRQLAQAHTLVANKTFSSPSATVSSGTLDITMAGQTKSIVVDSSNNTLEGIQKIINNGDYGIVASIINNGGSFQMMFSSKESGSASEMSVSGLSDFDVGGLTTTSSGQDAVMVLNGLTVTSSTNTFDNVINGMTFNLNSVDVGNPKAIKVGQDSQAVMDTITNFVNVYNQLGTILSELSKHDTSHLSQQERESEEFSFYGDLAGSSMLRSVRAEIQGSMSGVITELSGNINSLSMVGISFGRTGEMELDSAKLQNVINTDMHSVSNLFAKGGNSNDPLINFLAGSDRTMAGNYSLDITQLAERATVSGGATTVTTDERVAGDRIVNSQNALILGSGASFNLSIGGGAVQSINLNALAGSYATKDDLSASIQAQIDVVVGAGIVSFSYDASQSRYELTAAAGEGSLVMTDISGLSNQGFSLGSYAGEGLIDLSAAPASFNIVVDGSVSSNVSIAQSLYTQSELAERISSSINANSDVKTAGAAISVSVNAGAIEITSSRFGALSNVEITNFSHFDNAGFNANLLDTGLNVDGTLTTNGGTLNIGAYASSEDGRIVKISDFAAISGGIIADARGLQFEVIGGALGARGDLSYSQGFASKLSDTIKAFFEEDTGIVSQRIDSLSSRNKEFEERNERLDLRFEKQEMRYRMQFAVLQSIMASAQATRDQLTAQFNPPRN